MSDGTSGGAAATNFDALLGDIEGLAKSLPAAGEDGAAKIAAAAAEGEGDDDDKEGEGGETVAKALKLTLADGTEIDAVDGAELVKSLVDRIDTNEAAVMQGLRGLLNFCSSQGELVKSLQAEVKALGNAGKGRRTAVVVAHEKPGATADLVKSEEAGSMNGDEFMAKALAAQNAGRISGGQVAEAEAYINLNQAPPEHIVRAVLA